MKFVLRNLFFIVVLLILSAQAAFASSEDSAWLVTNTQDAGPGSLRQAILNANFTPGADTIQFDIAGNGPHTIQPLSPFPVITDTLVIDGTTQPGASCDSWSPELMIELDGSAIDEYTDGLVLAASDSSIRGLVINRFKFNGIRVVSHIGNNTFTCNFIGTDVTGTVALRNGKSGIYVSNSSGNRIGGTAPHERNLLSGNRWDGIAIFGEVSFDNVVQGNYVGTDVTGTVALGNESLGVFIDRAPLNIIGGAEAGARNVISANGWEGVYIYESTARGNVVIGNYIGTDVTGTIALGNTDSGLVISNAPGNLIGGSTPEERNIIAANGQHGVYISRSDAYQNIVIGNYIGTDVTGSLDLGNLGSGVYLNNVTHNSIGGDDPRHANLIAGNSEYGIFVYGGPAATSNTLQANNLGTDASGETVIGNDLSDMWFEDSADALKA